MWCGQKIRRLHCAHAVTANMTRVASAVDSTGVPRRHIQRAETQNHKRVVRHTETGTIQSFGWVGQTTPPLQKEYMQPMIVKEDFRHVHAAYLKGQEISRDKELIDNHVIPAAFKAAMASSHMELF